MAGHRQSLSPRPAGRHAAVLMEVVLAMGLFFMAASMITGGLSSSARALERARVRAQAMDLAVTKMSELQMRLVTLMDQGPTQYDDAGLEGWTWQIAVHPVEDVTGLATLSRVEVVIANEQLSAFCQLSQLLPSQDPSNVFDEPLDDLFEEEDYEYED